MKAPASRSVYRDYRTFLRERYGVRTQRVPLDLGLPCPHRDPRTGQGGCSFCGAGQARARHLRPGDSLEDQVRRGVASLQRRFGSEVGLLAYFQAGTATNAEPSRLRDLFGRVLETAPFRGVIVSTRPDCLATEVLDHLEELSTDYDVWVELGIQTAHDPTLERIGRGHDFACSERAVEALNARGIHTAAHVILGLPGETRGHVIATAEALSRLPLEGVKCHNLHIVKGTRLAQAWRNGEVRDLDEHQYLDLLIAFLRRTPADRPVMRLVSNTDPRALLAPRWWMSKAQFTRLLERTMHDRGWYQGDLT
jgi:radical SAM protein (TIGR01212 family)